jgi:predicted lipoprotein with Yx(FWY)xxD motif
MTVAAIAAGAAATVAGVVITTATGFTSHDAGPASRSVPSPAPPIARNLTGVAAVHTARATVQGTVETILVDAKGWPLYIYPPDTATTSHVTGQLAVLWPPLFAPHRAVRRLDDVLTSVTTTNGEQVAYRGHFLYTFVEDSPGHVTGQGVQNFLVATPGLAGGLPAESGNAP